VVCSFWGVSVRRSRGTVPGGWWLVARTELRSLSRSGGLYAVCGLFTALLVVAGLYGRVGLDATAAYQLGLGLPAAVLQ